MTKFHALVTLDGSETSAQILPTVQKLFDPERAQLTLLHVVGPPRSPYETANIAPDVVMVHSPKLEATMQQEWEMNCQAMREVLDARAENLRRAGYAVDIALPTGETGSAADEIVQYVAEHNIDVLAMISHGRRGLSKMLMGSVAEEVLRRVLIPVLIQRPAPRSA